MPIDEPKHFVKSNGNYALETSWGETQYIIEDPSDIYAVSNSAFKATYKEIEKKAERRL